MCQPLHSVRRLPQAIISCKLQVFISSMQGTVACGSPGVIALCSLARSAKAATEGGGSSLSVAYSPKCRGRLRSAPSRPQSHQYIKTLHRYVCAAGPGYGADLVSHEATFSEGMEQKAMVAQHSTARMAGEFAQQLQAQTLVLTHFSARYSANQV